MIFMQHLYKYANDAAKEPTGNQFIGEGSDSCLNYLMNELFEQIGYDGPAFMKITNSVGKSDNSTQ